MNFAVRPATEADIPLLVQILNEANQFKLSHGDDVWGTEDWTADEVLERMAKAPAYLFYVGDEAIGTVSLQWEDEKAWGPLGIDNQAGYIHRLAVKNRFHGQDRGGKIMDWAAKQVAMQDRKFMRLDCATNNKKLCIYYEDHGFVRLQDRPIPEFGDYVAALYQRSV